ncbi:THO complex subunit 7 homolog [Macrosteles quadrilineatus]|uniref:THO complex subunit 7 homolog n=1 Tax=Macrosteles quadrilineatus TaxID=74068 RepID=UPI0023E2D276|nr:THO complex subunit 7 homolog [Macrosteles quadrilineatus]
MTDEDVIRRRLLIDGDGTGDDRRLNMLLKTFIKWCCTTHESPIDSQSTLDRILSQLTQSEYTFTKSRIMATTSSAELQNYENLLQQISDDIERAKQEIGEKKLEFKKAKIIRKNRAEYEVLANVINEQPDRKQTDEKLSQLKKELNSLEEKSEKLNEQMELRRKQFHVLIASIHQLEALLDASGANDSLDVFDDEDMDILNMKSDGDPMEVS